MENSLVAVYIVQDGLFRFVNAPFCEISGYTSVEITDRLGPWIWSTLTIRSG